MRQVEIKYRIYTPETRSWTDEITTQGWFHQWGLEACEGGPDTYAIVELQDGTIKCISTDKIKFLDKP